MHIRNTFEGQYEIRAIFVGSSELLSLMFIRARIVVTSGISIHNTSSEIHSSSNVLRTSELK